MQAGPQRPGEESRTVLEKNPVKLEENWSGENSCESGENYCFVIIPFPLPPSLAIAVICHYTPNGAPMLYTRRHGNSEEGRAQR